MKIATWNVNSIRARLPRLLAWLESRRPDAVMLQELKCVDGEFPFEELREVGYEAAAYGQKTYNGVAILAKETPGDVRRGLPDDGAEAEARVVSAVVGGVRLIDVYVVNGQRVGTPAYEYKLQWMERLRRYVESFDRTAPLVLAGDFNVTFDDRDVYDPKLMKDRILC
ncbi:MAG: endonuclease/exonuclease/phosphatase family protein, partial [Rhodocyclaceae bacterium]|nr:endonuclease/exonuclease/phosphatase family protein [Rhodocyclaceae bacterium]